MVKLRDRVVVISLESLVVSMWESGELPKQPSSVPIFRGDLRHTQVKGKVH